MSDSCLAMLWPPLRVPFLYGTPYFKKVMSPSDARPTATTPSSKIKIRSKALTHAFRALSLVTLRERANRRIGPILTKTKQSAVSLAVSLADSSPACGDLLQQSVTAVQVVYMFIHNEESMTALLPLSYPTSVSYGSGFPLSSRYYCGIDVFIDACARK